MKKYLIFILFAALGTIGNLPAQAVIKFEKNSMNLGKFTENQPVSCVFVFTNTGNEPLVIQQAIASCGCTVPKYTEAPILPGKKGQITVTYNGRGQFPGHFRKPITIRSTASNRQVRIYIEGDMEPKKK